MNQLIFLKLESVYRVQNNITIFQRRLDRMMWWFVPVFPALRRLRQGHGCELEAGVDCTVKDCLGYLERPYSRQTDRKTHTDWMIHSEVVLSPYPERPITQRLQLLWVGSKMSDPLTHRREVTREECRVAMGMPRDHLSGNGWPDCELVAAYPGSR